MQVFRMNDAWVISLRTLDDARLISKLDLASCKWQARGNSASFEIADAKYAQRGQKSTVTRYRPIKRRFAATKSLC